MCPADPVIISGKATGTRICFAKTKLTLAINDRPVDPVMSSGEETGDRICVAKTKPTITT